jgi:hypothetical protein
MDAAGGAAQAAARGGSRRVIPRTHDDPALDTRKCNIITFRSERPMTHHSHPVGQRHEPAFVTPSILRLSAWQRLAGVAVIIAALWGAVHWAMS